MAGRALLSRAEAGFTMPAFERLAPPPSPELVLARLEAATGPGDIVADLHGRGGWIAGAAIDRQRRALTLESSPLTRLLAEVVLRPPDLRHLDAAFSTLSASPRGDSSLKLAIGAFFTTRCPTCERSLVADEFVWSAEPADAPAAGAGFGARAGTKGLPLLCLSRPTGRARAAPGADGRRGPGACCSGCGSGRDPPASPGPLPGSRGRRRPGRRHPRPPHGSSARRPDRDPRADRGRSPRGAGGGRPPARFSPRGAPCQPTRYRPGPDPGDPHRRGG